MYRKFRIKSTLTQDDPKSMYEVISRRLKHAVDWPLPDVILIDGGKTQLSMVKKAFEDLGENSNIYGMVKNDRHRTRGLIDLDGNEFDLSDKKKILNFLTFLQDEKISLILPWINFTFSRCLLSLNYFRRHNFTL